MSHAHPTRRIAATIALVLIPVNTGTAQPTPSTTERLLARADSITVADYCTVARAVVQNASVRTALASDSTVARLSADRVCDPFWSRFTLRALLGTAPAPLSAVARLERNSYRSGRRDSPSESMRGLVDAMSLFREAVRTDDARAATRAALGDSTNGALVRIVETAQGVLTVAARDAALARLARYERKLGPTSARLNGPEVLLNWAAQRWVPGFAPSATRGPSPLEIVASYVPTYATWDNKRPQPVSASEFGVRWYLFGERFGQSGARGLLFPSYWSAGALVVSDRNGALVWPWDGRTRTGVYASWGATKVGVVPGRSASVVVSRQFQSIPLVF